MPTYSYKCKDKDCNYSFEMFHAVWAEKPSCPICRGEVEKVLTADHKIQINEPWRDSKSRMS